MLAWRISIGGLLLGPAAWAGVEPEAPASAIDADASSVEGWPTLARQTEVSVGLGAISGDYFSRGQVARVRVVHHVADPFAVEWSGALCSDLGSRGRDTNWTHGLDHLSDPTPLLTRPRGLVGAAVQFTPLQGMVSGGRRPVGLGVYGLLGVGAAWTRDVEHSVQCLDDCPGGLDQLHPSRTLGGGMRLWTRRLVFRGELRDLAWIEVYRGFELSVERRLFAELSIGGFWGPGPPRGASP